MTPNPTRRRGKPQSPASPASQAPAPTMKPGGQASVSPHFSRRGLMRRETYREGRALLSRSYVNAFLLFVPLGIGSGCLGARAEAVFWLNWLAIVPLAPAITMAVLELSVDAGRIQGGLVKAILGNTVEMIICVIAMLKGHITLVHCMIIGSILSYSLLFLGCSCLVASFGKESISYSRKQTGLMTALMMVASISLVIPTVVTLARGSSRLRAKDDTLHLSRGAAVVLFLLFIAYLIFRFRTHRSVFAVGTTDDDAAPSRSLERTDSMLSQRRLGLIYLVATACVIVCSIYMIGSLKTAAESMYITRSFVGVVLVPLVGNVGKATVIIGHAHGGNINRAIRHIMTNVLDTLLFITPFLVLFGWIIGQPMELEFGLFEAIVFILAIIVMTNVLQPGKATYFEGAMLMGTYVVIAVAFFVVH